MEDAVRLTQLHYHAGTRELLNISGWSLAPGSRLALLGANGSGKSTLLSLLAGVTHASRGEVSVFGQNPFLTPSCRQQIGYLPADTPLQDSLSVSEQLQWAARLFNTPAARVDELLQTHELTGIASKRCGHLSTGFRQRVGLAQAMVHHPSLLLLDEPSRGLDLAQTVAFHRRLQALPAATTLIIATHQPADVQALCEQLLVLQQGQIALQGSRAGLAADDSALQQLFFNRVLQPACGTEPA